MSEPEPNTPRPRTTGSRESRLHAFDALRAFAMLAVVFGHSLLSFMETPIGWAITDESTWLGADFLVWCFRCFVLPLFFLLSGLLAHVLIARDGLASFLKSRAQRLLVPLAIFLVPVSWAMNSMWDWGRELVSRPEVAATVPHLEGSELPVTLAHLWFLYYLFIVSVVVGVVFWGVRRLAGRDVGSGVRGAWLPLTLIPAIAGVLWWAGKLQLDTPLGFIPNAPVLTYHAVFFVWGWLLQPHAKESLGEYARRAPLWGALAIGFLGMTLADLVAGTVSLPGIMGSAGFSVAATATLLGLSTFMFTATHPVVRALSDSAYWCYIVHLPIVVLLQIAMSQVSLPGPLEFSVVFGVAMAVSFATYHYGVRGRYLERFVG